MRAMVAIAIYAIESTESAVLSSAICVASPTSKKVTPFGAAIVILYSFAINLTHVTELTSTSIWTVTEGDIHISWCS